MATKTSPSRRSSSRASSRPAGKKTSFEAPVREEAGPEEEAAAGAPRPRSSRRSRATRWASGSWSSPASRCCPCGSTPPGRWATRSRASCTRASGSRPCCFRSSGSGWGIALLRDRSPEERMRMFIGFVIMGLGVLGLVSILRGNPGVFAPAVDTKVRGAGVTQGFSDAGGFFGTLGAYPLSKVDVAGRRVPRRPGPRRDRHADHDGHLVRRARAEVRQRPGRRSPRSVRGEGAPTSRRRRRRSSRSSASRTSAPSRRREEAEKGHQGEAHRAARSHRAGRGAAGIRGARGARPAAGCGRRGFRGRTSVPTKARGRHDHDGRRALPASFARPVAHRATVDERRRAREGHHGGARTHALDVRRRRQGDRRPSWAYSDDVRGGGRLGHQGQQGAEPLERYRLRARDARRAHHRPDPGQVRDRHRGAEPPPRLRDARRHPALQGRQAGHPSAARSPSGRTSTASPRW